MIAIYYIATGTYKLLFEDFYNSVPNFLPQYNKKIILISDGLEEYKDKEDIIYHHIDDYPWPIITLFKMDYILRFFDYGSDYHFYFNANSIINKIEFELNKDSLILAQHSCKVLREYNPVQAAFFGGNTQVMLDCCKGVSALVEKGLLANQIPQFHDETYLNIWSRDYNNKVVMDLLSIGKETKLIYLQNKSSKKGFRKKKSSYRKDQLVKY